MVERVPVWTMYRWHVSHLSEIKIKIRTYTWVASSGNAKDESGLLLAFPNGIINGTVGLNQKNKLQGRAG
jgi:hypothetical protein